MNLLPMLIAGHLIGDWIVQSDWQAANKTREPRAMIQHLVGYHVALIAFAAMAWPGFIALAIILVVSWVTHFALDLRFTVRWLMRHTASREFADTTWGVLVVEQALHISILCVLAAVLG